jgi:hypothetical protein
LCKDLGFEFVNIYELSCRSTIRPLNEEQIENITKKEELSEIRKNIKLGGKSKRKTKRKTKTKKQKGKLKNKLRFIE